MDRFFELLLGPLYDKLFVKFKRLRARLLLRYSSEVDEWFRDDRYDGGYVDGIAGRCNSDGPVLGQGLST